MTTALVSYTGVLQFPLLVSVGASELVVAFQAFAIQYLQGPSFSAMQMVIYAKA